VPPDIAYLGSPPKPISIIAAAEPTGPEPSRVPDENTAAPPAPSKPAFANNETPANPQPEAETPKGFSRKEGGLRARPSAAEAAKVLRNDVAASKATAKKQPKKNDTQPVAPIPAATGASYLFVKSFLREDRAQEAKTKIEALGMPAGVVSKHGAAGDFYIVYSGPFPDAQVASAMQKLEEKGFSNVRSAPVPLRGGNAKQ
jgi:cell division septation protein DedD